MPTQHSINYKNVVIMDFGSDVSACSSYAAARCLAQQSNIKIVFAGLEKFMESLPEDEGIHHVFGFGSSLYYECEHADIVLDFTELGKGMTETMLIVDRIEHFHLNKMIGDASILQKKIDFLSLHLSKKLSVHFNSAAISKTPVFTYDANMAARLNMLGIPTIELCYRFRQHGSFLANSLVIFGDNFALITKPDLDMLFTIYQMGQINNLFMNKPILELDWDLLYYSLDKSKTTLATKKYPVSPMETFLDVFFRSFLLDENKDNAGIEQLVSLTKKIDSIDLEETFRFIKNQLQQCLRDLDEEDFPLSGPWWNYVRSYLTQDMLTSAPELTRGVRKCIIGLEMFESIYERQRKLLSMH
ncbi:MAG: hypothetical protein H6623_04460 [Bdellovibrionaceae bacterium]|nr:hypothetical protein [Pseudobdellovibrionaceae bacterium]